MLEGNRLELFLPLEMLKKKICNQKLAEAG